MSVKYKIAFHLNPSTPESDAKNLILRRLNVSRVSLASCVSVNESCRPDIDRVIALTCGVTKLVLLLGISSLLLLGALNVARTCSVNLHGNEVEERKEGKNSKKKIFVFCSISLNRAAQSRKLNL